MNKINKKIKLIQKINLIIFFNYYYYYLDALKAHANDITKMQYFEDKKLLLTSSKEKIIKVSSD